MTSWKPSNNNTLELDGIRFETLVPEQKINLPMYGEEISVQFGFCITNQSLTPYRFELQRFLPEFQNSRRYLIKIKGFNRNVFLIAQDEDIPLIESGNSCKFLIDAKFSWYNRDYLHLTGYAVYGGLWDLYKFSPGRYRVRFAYKNQLSKHQMLLNQGWTEVDNFWIGNVETPFVNLRLR